MTSLSLRWIACPDRTVNLYLGSYNAQGETGRLWQRRFFDCALRTAKEYHEKLEFVHRDPVKAGLVSRAGDGLWSSMHDYTADYMGRLDVLAKNSRHFGCRSFLVGRR